MIVHSVCFYNFHAGSVKSEWGGVVERLDEHGCRALHTPNHAKFGLAVRAPRPAGGVGAGPQRRSLRPVRFRQGGVWTADSEVSVGVRQGAFARDLAQER